MQSPSSKLYKAIKSSMISRVSTYLVQFAAMVFYARLFTPEEFGLVASVHVFVLLFQLLCEAGLTTAIINEGDIDQKKRDHFFGLTVALGGLFCTLFWLFSFVLNSLYSYGAYQYLAPFFCVSILFQSISVVPLSALQRETQFGQIALADISGELCASTIVFIGWYFGLGVFALCLRPPSVALVRFCLFYVLAGKRSMGFCKIGWSNDSVRSIIGFSSYQLGFNFINYFTRNLDNILIGRYLGIQSLGVYDRAYQLMRYPLQLITFSMTPAIQPILRKHKDNLQLVVSEHNILVEKVFIVSIFIALYMFFLAEEIILILFGEVWIEVAPLVQIFAVMIPVQMVMSTSGAFFLAMGRPGLLFTCGVIGFAICGTAIITGTILGTVEYIAMALTAGFYINFIQVYFILFKRCFNSPFGDFYRRLGGVALRYVPVTIALYSALQWLTVTQNSWVSLVGNCAIGLVVLILSCLIFARTMFANVLSSVGHSNKELVG